MERIEIYTADYEWLEEMSSKTDLPIHDLIDTIIDEWVGNHGDSTTYF